MEERAPGQVQPGQVLAGKYRVEGVLGQGGMGVVLAATHLELDRRVALKLLLPQALQDPATRERFHREARAAAKLRSAHVAQVIDVGKLESGEPYMVMEYLVGQDLGQCIETSGPLAVADAVDYVAQACEAIAEAHAAGIVHRDLKPANLFLTRGFNGAPCVKVLDFGISKSTASEESHALTSTSAVMGSPLYMSPEQLESSRNVDTRTDIWALGAIVFELIAGAPPFGGETLPQVMLGILRDPTPSLRARRADVPPGLDAAVAACLEKDRTRRPATVQALVAAIAPFGSAVARASLDSITRLVDGSAATQLGSSGLAVPLEPKAMSHGVMPSAPMTALSPQPVRAITGPSGGQTGGAWGATSDRETGLPRSGSSRALLWLLAACVFGGGGVLLIQRFVGAPVTPPSLPAARVPEANAQATPPTVPSAAPAMRAPLAPAAPTALSAAESGLPPVVGAAVAPSRPIVIAPTPPRAKPSGKASAIARPESAPPPPPRSSQKPSDLFSDRQ